MKYPYPTLPFVALFATCFITLAPVHAQNTLYGIKGGIGAGFQRYNGQESSALFPAYNGSVFLETVLEGKSRIVLEAGYHQRGSAVLFRGGTYQDPINPAKYYTIPPQTFPQVFHNVGIVAALRNVYDLPQGYNPFWSVGVRGEYTVQSDFTLYDGFEPYINKFNYGITIAGGVEKAIPNTPLILQLELSAHPDFSQQIYTPPGYYYNTYTMQRYQVGEQKVINTTFELTLGIKFGNYATDEEPTDGN